MRQAQKVVLRKHPKAFVWHWKDLWVIYAGDPEGLQIGHCQRTRELAWVSARNSTMSKPRRSRALTFQQARLAVFTAGGRQARQQAAYHEVVNLI